jgi:hypothetical protein
VLAEVPIGEVCARVYAIPTVEPESDGTLEWGATTLIVVTAGPETRRAWAGPTGTRQWRR